MTMFSSFFDNIPLSFKMPTPHAKMLFQEFKTQTQLYCAFASTLGLSFGLLDGPSRKVQVPAQSPEPTEATGAPEPRELGFWRRFLLTSPGVVLAFRLGLRAKALQATGGSIALAVVPTVWGPLLLYLVIAYPAGVELNKYFYVASAAS